MLTFAFCLLTFLIFASYVTQNTGAKPEVPPDSGSSPKAGVWHREGSQEHRPASPKTLCLGKLSRTSVKERASHLPSSSAAAGSLFSETLLVLDTWDLTASCRSHLGFLELHKGRLRLGLGLTSVDLTYVPPAVHCRVTHFMTIEHGLEKKDTYDRVLAMYLATYPCLRNACGIPDRCPEVFSLLLP